MNMPNEWMGGVLDPDLSDSSDWVLASLEPNIMAATVPDPSGLPNNIKVKTLKSARE